MSKKIPEKLFYKIGEVCELTDTQPYVLRFWESEFPQLAPQKNRSGQRIYRKRDMEIVEEIKRLLYDEGYTIAGARKRLEQEEEGDPPARMPLLDRVDEGDPDAAATAEPAAGEASAAAADPRREALEQLREILRLMKDFDRKIAALARKK